MSQAPRPGSPGAVGPAAVLLVEVGRGRVVHANPAAQALAPGVRLPVTVEQWSDAVGLADAGGRPLAAADDPLRRVAAGHPVGGRAVTVARAAAVPRRATTPAAAGREALWAVGVALGHAPRLDGLAMVVLLPRPAGERPPPDLAAVVGERAVVATGVSFTVCDARAPDQPLVWVNPAFSATTGYTVEESVGRNCRFLQGPATDPAAHGRIRTALDAGEDLTTTVLNYRRDGSAFWNQLTISPVRDDDGALTHFVGIQTDVTARVLLETEREQALAAERRARQDAEESRRRLALVAEATSLLASTLDVTASLERLARLVVPLLADWVVVNLVDEDGTLSEVSARHRDGHRELLARFSRLQPFTLGPAAPVRRVIASGRPLLIPHYGSDRVLASTGSPELVDICDRLGLGSVAIVPMRARRRTLGSIALVTGSSGRVLRQQDLDVAADIGRRAALTIDNARLYEREHRAAEILQRSLLPDLPDIDGVTSAARYVAGDTAAQVGGDFYELLALPDGAVGIAVGDVVGHDLAAAAAMGHLRGLLRACAWDAAADSGGDPAQVLTRVDRLVQGLQVAPLATLWYGRLARLGGGGWRLSYASAGHPPPLLRAPSGATSLLDGGGGILLGVDAEAARAGAVVDLAAGSAVVLYTDGLVERRGEDLDTGIEWARSVVEAAPASARPDEVCDLLTVGLAGVEDDTAVLAVALDAGSAGLRTGGTRGP